MKKIKGPYAVLMTPFNGKTVDEEAFVKQINRLNGSDLSGYVVNGSTSEFVQLSLAEQMRMITVAAENKAENKQLIVGAGTGNLSDTYDICAYAGKAGAAAVLVCPPYYFKYTTSERAEYFKKIADISPVPVLIYNIPFFTQEIEMSLVYDLLGHKNIIGIKDSSANMKRLEHTIEVVDGKDVSVMTGTDDILFPALVGGCDGSMTAFATIFPDKICSLYKAVENGDYVKAKEIQFSMMADLRKADGETFPKGYKKLMQEIGGIRFGDKEVKPE